MIKATLDTNVIVSALIKPNGKPAQILDQRAKFELVLSDAILQEADTALHRKHIQKKYSPSSDSIEKLFATLREFSTMVHVQHVENIVPNDPPDNLVLACAVEGKADYLVSGDLHLLDLEQHRGIKIATPAQFLEILMSTRS
jgi:putative PIN family toxin of toxin-antitoxin system